MQSGWDASAEGCKYTVKSYPVTTLANILSLQLLEREPSRRLACKPRAEGFEELRQHPWFRSIDWVTLQNKEEIPPFVPDVSALLIDLSCCLEESHYSPKKPISTHHTSWKSYYWKTTP